MSAISAAVRAGSLPWWTSGSERYASTTAGSRLISDESIAISPSVGATAEIARPTIRSAGDASIDASAPDRANPSSRCW